MGNPELEKKTGAVARRLARESGMPEGFWEMFLPQAYQEVVFGDATPAQGGGNHE